MHQRLGCRIPAYCPELAQVGMSPGAGSQGLRKPREGLDHVEIWPLFPGVSHPTLAPYSHASVLAEPKSMAGA